MKLDEFAFFNQQLAAMLRDGIPLESALGQLCASMRRGDLRDELEKLRADLANGFPIDQALASRNLPPFYVQMIQVGVKSNDLPGVLTLVADYYESSNLMWTRLKGLLVYPAIVLGGTLALSILLAVLFGGLMSELRPDIWGDYPLAALRLHAIYLGLWLPVVLLGALASVVVIAILQPRFRSWLRWRLPGFREASLWRVASTMGIMLKGGTNLSDAISLMTQMERDSGAAGDLALWQARLSGGQTDFGSLATPTSYFPPLFIWLVSGAREDLTAGMNRAAEIYRARSEYRTETLLQAVLPVSVLILGALIFTQVFVLIQMLIGCFTPLFD